MEHARPSRSGGYRNSSYGRDRRDYGGRSEGRGFTFREKYVNVVTEICAILCVQY